MAHAKSLSALSQYILYPVGGNRQHAETTRGDIAIAPKITAFRPLLHRGKGLCHLTNVIVVQTRHTHTTAVDQIDTELFT
ncbi:Uncharacterised protein [Serratia fonticola]|uniref:Uncharacterized protein n=1 Tax=Serratia fonticola TaxID=47917 RepID=A0A4U9V066_SERFO|nr:Uncharacterised protein [Serratia fonticola]